MATFALFADGVDVDLLEGVDDKSRRLAAVRAINKIARDARTEAARRILQQIAVPASYVQPGERRLYVSREANSNSLEARITARGRATSLARYVVGNPKTAVAGVTVRVHPGLSTYMRRAFLINLPGVGGSTDTGLANRGLAVRLKPGDTLRNKNYARRVASGLYVLYGPSVAQVFRDNADEGVANEMAPSVAQKLANEFLRLIE
jgi:hypothetical protein